MKVTINKQVAKAATHGIGELYEFNNDGPHAMYVIMITGKGRHDQHSGKELITGVVMYAEPGAHRIIGETSEGFIKSKFHPFVGSLTIEA